MLTQGLTEAGVPLWMTMREVIPLTMSGILTIVQIVSLWYFHFVLYLCIQHLFHLDWAH